MNTSNSAENEKERERGTTLYHSKSGSKRKEESVCINNTIQRETEYRERVKHTIQLQYNNKKKAMPYFILKILLYFLSQRTQQRVYTKPNQKVQKNFYHSTL